MHRFVTFYAVCDKMMRSACIQPASDGFVSVGGGAPAVQRSAPGSTDGRAGEAAGREDSRECLALGPMPAGMACVTIAAMNRSSSKIMLIADRRNPGEARGVVAVRRFRLARLRHDGAVVPAASRAVLKRG